MLDDTFPEKLETNSNETQLQAREKLLHLFKNNNLPAEELMTSLGLFIRGSALVKYLVLNDLYTRILKTPGTIIEFGTCWGQNLILFENLRAIYEPFNKTRKIVGFDTFTGYPVGDDNDKNGDVFKEGNYKLEDDYEDFLKDLLNTHVECNVLGNNKSIHEVIKGDVSETVREYFQNNPSELISLAYFDMGLYKPTKVALEEVLKHTVPGSIILLDQLTWSDAPGEALAFKEVFKDVKYEIEISKFTPMRSIITLL